MKPAGWVELFAKPITALRAPTAARRNPQHPSMTSPARSPRIDSNLHHAMERRILQIPAITVTLLPNRSGAGFAFSCCGLSPRLRSASGRASRRSRRFRQPCDPFGRPVVSARSTRGETGASSNGWSTNLGKPANPFQHCSNRHNTVVTTTGSSGMGSLTICPVCAETGVIQFLHL
jgi:hypothetical protein